MKRNHKDMLTLVGVAAAVIAFVAIGIYYEIGLWQECRATNSWFYCMRVLVK